MTKRESLPKIEAEPKEFLFEDGLKKIIEKINQLFSAKDYVVAAIGGPMGKGGDTRVGKTTLSSKLEINFIRQSIPVISAANLDSLESQLQLDPHGLTHQQKNRGSSKCLIILDAIGLLSLPQKKQAEHRGFRDKNLQEVGATAGLSLSKIDLYILIYRPDKLPSTDQRQFADIIIRNELAKD